VNTKKTKKTQLAFLFGLLACISTACSGSQATSDGSSGSTAASLNTGPGELSISNTDVSIYVHGTYPFSAVGGIAPYRFYVVTGEGSINESTGVYTAEGEAGSATVVVIDSTNTDAYATVTVQGLNLNLTVSPASITVNEGASYSFTASGGTAPYTYSVISGGGSIYSTSGVYVAPQATGTATIQVRDTYGNFAYSSVTIASSSTGSLPPVPLYREYDSSTGFHMSTLVSGEGAPSYAVEETLLHVYSSQISSTIVPLYRCSVGSNIHFSTTSATCEGITGASLELQMGWVDSVQGSGEVALYRLHNTTTGDCIDSLSSSEGTQDGYVLDGALGFALPLN
jgi:hypothetical protein